MLITKRRAPKLRRRERTYRRTNRVANAEQKRTGGSKANPNCCAPRVEFTDLWAGDVGGRDGSGCPLRGRAQHPSRNRRGREASDGGRRGDGRQLRRAHSPAPAPARDAGAAAAVSSQPLRENLSAQRPADLIGSQPDQARILSHVSFTVGIKRHFMSNSI